MNGAIKIVNQICCIVDNTKVYIINESVTTSKEEPTEELICGICLEPQTEPFKTSCNHTFCVSCLVRASIFKNQSDFPCPLCRETVVNMTEAIQLYKNNKTNEKIDAINISTPFNPELYPIRVDFEFAEPESVGQMLISAYNVITREEKWKFLHDYDESEQHGFIWSRDTEINILLGKIEDDSGGHSGSSMGYTIRKMHYIAKYGYNEFKNEWNRWN